MAARDDARGDFEARWRVLAEAERVQLFVNDDSRCAGDVGLQFFECRAEADDAASARLHPDRATLDAAYKAAAREPWRARLATDWSTTETEGWPS